MSCDPGKCPGNHNHQCGKCRQTFGHVLDLSAHLCAALDRIRQGRK